MNVFSEDLLKERIVKVMLNKQKVRKWACYVFKCSSAT